MSEDDAAARTDDEAGQLWKTLEKRLGVDLASQVPVKGVRKPAERSSTSQSTSNTPERVSRIPVASYRLQKTKTTAAESKSQAAVVPTAPTSSRTQPPKLGPGQCAPLRQGSARRNAISVDPSFRRVLSAASKLPMSSSMKDPTLSMISEGPCETPRNEDRAEVTEANVGILDSTLRSLIPQHDQCAEVTPENVGILDSTLKSLLIYRQASNTGSEYSQDSAPEDSEDSGSSDEEPLATPPAARQKREQAGLNYVLDANLLRQKLSKVLAKQARHQKLARIGSLDKHASLADMTAMLRTDSPDVTLETTSFDLESSYIGFASQARRSAVYCM